MDQFSVIHNRLKNLLFFFSPKQMRLFCFLCLRKKKKKNRQTASSRVQASDNKLERMANCSAVVCSLQ